MPVLTRDGVRIAWSDQGAGTPILLIMGHRYSSAMWYPVIEGLGDRYRLISFDNRGTGQSTTRRGTTVADMTADALAVLDAAGVDSAHIYGVSMGGGIALEFALRYPERTRSVILGCTTAKTPDKKSQPHWLLNILYRLPMPLLKAMAPKQHKQGYGDAAPDAAIARDQQMLAKDPFTRRGVLDQALAISNYAVGREAVRGLKKPALVLHGTQDLVLPYALGEELADLIPGAQLVTLKDCGHNYFVGAWDAANAAVDTFVTGVEQGR